MKRFRFSLERVLRLRGQETEQAKRELGRALAAEAQARAAVAEARSELVRRTDEAGQRERSGLTAYEFASLRTYVTFLQRQLEATELRLTEAVDETQRRRLALLGARRKERALEKLRERRLEQYQLESLQQEQKELDEYGSRQTLNSQATEPDV
ncbi:MAG TPA: flagellar export protein FliJ [Symbiobacteriaceae bacterium]|nr:flagellar export protein FliJ [Symbiobacteriaceae bacterium]